MKLQISTSASLKFPTCSNKSMSAKDKEALQKKLTPLMGAPVKNFWDIVKVIGWGTKTIDYVSVARILSKFPEAKVGALRSNAQALEQKAFDFKLKKDPNNEIWGRGDDGTSDCINHLIGLGEKYYNALLKNPADTQDVADVYSESFAYCFNDNMYRKVSVKDTSSGNPSKDAVAAVLAKLTKADIAVLRKNKDLI